MLETVAYPSAPTTTALRGTLLDAATRVDQFKWQDGRALWDSYNCMKFQAEPVFCGPDTKDFDEVIAWQNGTLFGAYGGATCKSIGLSQERMMAEVSRVFMAGESTAVERALMKYRFPEFTFAGDTDPAWTETVDITPSGTAVSPVVGMALLEGFAGDNYVGTPTLHLPRTIASILSSNQRIEFSGSTLYTKLGSKVAAGVGYDYPNNGPDGTEADPGEKWIYATGEVSVASGEMILHQNFLESTNEVFVLAERPYIVVVDCFTAAVLVTVTD